MRVGRGVMQLYPRRVLLHVGAPCVKSPAHSHHAHCDQQGQAEIADEIERGRLEVAKLRAKLGGGRLGSLELGPLMLPNPAEEQVRGVWGDTGSRGHAITALRAQCETSMCGCVDRSINPSLCLDWLG